MREDVKTRAGHRPGRTSSLNPSSYAVMALIGDGGASAHEIVGMVGRGGPLFWSAAASNFYAEPKRLERLGYLSSAEAPGKTRTRRVYRLTAKGRRALRAWLARPSAPPKVQIEPTLRLLAGDMIADERIVDSITALRPELDRLWELVAENQRSAAAIPHRRRYLELQLSLARRLLGAYGDWVDEVERELG